MANFSFLGQVIRERPLLAYPLTYPEASDRFYGYTKKRIAAWYPTAIEQGTKELITGVTHTATALLALRAHQYVGTKSASIRLYREYIADEYQLVFYDQRGTGLSNGRLDLKAISIDQFVEDLEALRVAFGFEKISLIGHSWGAVIALFYAFKYQAHLDKLILVDPRPVTNMFVVEQGETVKQRFGRLSPEAQQTLNTTCKRPSTELSSEAHTECIKLAAALDFYDPAKALTVDATTEENTARNASTIQSLIRTSFYRMQQDIDAKLKTVSVPTWIIHGDFDPIPIGSSQYIQQRIRASQLVIIKESGHFPFVEQPEMFFAAIRAFMRA